MSKETDTGGAPSTTQFDRTGARADWTTVFRTALLIFAVFSVAGAGIGASFVAIFEPMQTGGTDDGGGYGLLVIFVPFLELIAVVGVLLAISLAMRLSDTAGSNVQGYAAVGIGTFLGQLSMWALYLLLTTIYTSGSSDSDGVIQLVTSATAVALTGMVVTYLVRNHDL